MTFKVEPFDFRVNLI